MNRFSDAAKAWLTGFEKRRVEELEARIKELQAERKAAYDKYVAPIVRAESNARRARRIVMSKAHGRREHEIHKDTRNARRAEARRINRANVSQKS